MNRIVGPRLSKLAWHDRQLVAFGDGSVTFGGRVYIHFVFIRLFSLPTAIADQTQVPADII